MFLNFRKSVFIFASLFICICAFAQAGAQQVYPQPQFIKFTQERFVPQRAYQVKGLIDADGIEVLKEVIKIDSSESSLTFLIRPVDKNNKALQRSGAYQLFVAPKQIVLEAFDARAVFYAAQTLKQLALKNSLGQITLPVVQVTDFPDVTYRGTVEGFYGEPWSHQDRLEQLRFYGQFKLNTYIYGPKDDPYHSSPHWRKPYPGGASKQIQELVVAARKNKVDFVWAIHPGKDISWNREDSNAIIGKFEMMYNLGVRSFAVFFDDISGAGTDAHKQAGLLNYIQQHFIESKKDVTPLIMCPTEYNKAWANKKEGTYLDILGAQLHPAIQIMWTGNTVVADITTEGLEWVNRRIRRQAFVWWNFPVSDYVRDHLLLGPAYGLETTAAPHLSGIVSNPMDKAEASKPAIFGVALYAWNMKSYEPQKAWQASLQAVMPEAPEAFERFAAHNSDPGPNGHRYRREESVQIKAVVDSFLNGYNNYTYSKAQSQAIQAEFTRMLPVAEAIKSKSNNKRLLEQLSPWLMQYQLLAKTGMQALLTAGAWHDKKPALAWQHFLHTSALIDSMNWVDRTFNQNPYQPGVKTGSLVLMPLVKKLHEHAARAFESGGQVAGVATQKEGVIQGSTVYSNAEKLRYQPLRSSNDQIALAPVLEVLTLAPGEYVGLQLHQALKAAALHLHLENNNLQTWGRFETSADGNAWQPFTVTERRGKGSYQGFSEQVRFVRFRNASDKPQSFYLKEYRLEVAPISQGDKSVFAVDGSVATWLPFSNAGRLKVTLPAALQQPPLTFLLQAHNVPFVITGIDNKGKRRVLYRGNENFVQVKKAKKKNLAALELTTTSDKPLFLYEITRWQP